MSMWVHVSMINFLQVFTRPFPCTRPRIATCCSTRLTTFQDRWRPSVLLSGFEWFRVSLWKLLLLFPIYHMNFEICIGQLVTQTSSRFATATSLTTCCLWLACCKHFGARCCFASDTKIQKPSLAVLPCFATLVTPVCGCMDAMFLHMFPTFWSEDCYWPPRKHTRIHHGLLQVM